MPTPSRTPTSGGRCATVGVSSTSHRSKTRSAFRATCSPCRIAHSRTRGVTQRPRRAVSRVRRSTRSGCSRPLHAGAHAGEELRHERGGRVGVAGVELLDVVAEGGEQRRGLVHRGHVLGVGPHAERHRLGRPADPQRRERRVDGRGERRRRLPGAPAVHRQRAAQHVVDHGAVPHRPGQRAGGAQRPPAVRVRRHRHAAALRLEAEEPAARRRDPDRAAAVAAEPERRPARPPPRRPSRRSSRPGTSGCPTGCG